MTREKSERHKRKTKEIKTSVAVDIRDLVIESMGKELMKLKLANHILYTVRDENKMNKALAELQRFRDRRKMLKMHRKMEEEENKRLEKK